MIIKEKKVYQGKLYQCTSFPSFIGTVFGVEFKSKMISSNSIFIKTKDGNFYEINDLKANGKNATKIQSKANECWDYFVEDLKPVYQTNSKKITTLTQILKASKDHGIER